MPVLDKFNLNNRVAIITGGAGLLGRKHAEAIKDAGGIPIIVDLDVDNLSDIVSNNSGIFSYKCDITRESDLNELLIWIQKEFSTLDILINNAAINPKVEDKNGLNSSRLEQYSLNNYQLETNVGLTAAFLCTKIFGTYMASLGKGVILNIASDLGIIAPNQSLYEQEGLSKEQQPVKPVTYSIIKHGLIGLTKYTATYWADEGIRCNALAPGGVENGQNNNFLQKISNLIPMKRMARVDEYQAAVIFLISEASSYMNGAVLSIDGGRSCW